MKPLLVILILVGSLFSIPAQSRTLQDINVISPRVLQRSVSRKFFKSLLISPVEGWIVVRAQVVDGHLMGASVLHSELDGAYDQLALQFANDFQIYGFSRMANPNTRPTVLLHLLVYKSADGTMILSFPTFESGEGNQMRYWGCARLAVIKRDDGRWVEIEGPESLHGKGWAVRNNTENATTDTAVEHEKKRQPKLAVPSASVLGPIIASTKR